MELTPKEIKFLTVMNETRLSDKKLFKRDSDEFRKAFSFTDEELITAVTKLVKMGLLSELCVGSNEIVYFHTDKAAHYNSEMKLKSIRH